MKQKEATSQTIKSAEFEMEVYSDPFNKRVRVDDYRGNTAKMIERAEELAAALQAEKLIIIGRKEDFICFFEKGLLCEAVVDRFFRGTDACYFTKYLTDMRRQSGQWMKEEAILRNVTSLSRAPVTITVPEEYNLIKVNQTNAENLANLYKQVFPIYPVPLFDSDYIRKTMERGTIYYAYLFNGKMISAASAEINRTYLNAELTDCATLPDFRKFGFMKQLLLRLEEDLVNQGIFCAYSIARAQSFGMNAVLHQLGYRYRGRLLNNCYIYQNLENMNMWVKKLSAQIRNE